MLIRDSSQTLNERIKVLYAKCSTAQLRTPPCHYIVHIQKGSTVFCQKKLVCPPFAVKILSAKKYQLHKE